MCGISGVIGARPDPTTVRAMLDAQHHRGPDDRGSYEDPDHPVLLCHNRLSIIDVSLAGHQPMASADGQVWLTFNGEAYNYEELRAQLPSYPYRSATDSEVVIAAYLHWGPGCVDHLIGQFAFALWDRRNGTLFCARDRLGIKPFHYALQNGVFTFASEVKGILASGVDAAPDMATWSRYLVHGYSDQSDATFFEGVSSLPPGHTLTLSVGAPDQFQLKRYWDLPQISGDILRPSLDEACGRLVDLLDDAVRLRLRSDVPLGVNLSGGLDSASMMTSVDRLSEETGALQTFTASFEDPTYDEADFADEVPRQSEWVRNVTRLTPADVVALAEDAVRHQEAPFGGIATLGYHRLHGLARDVGVTVLLEGQGVDELLGGYRYFVPHRLRDLQESGDDVALEAELAALGDDRAWAEEELDALVAGRPRNTYQDGTSHLRPECVVEDLRALAADVPRFERPFSDHLRNVLYRDLRHTKLPRVLRMNDRLSMAFSRELREPYLDHRLVEYVFRLPGEMKIHGGASKVLLRHAMAERLPLGVRGTPKRAVVTPQREWLRGPLASFVQEIIGSPEFEERGLFDVPAVSREFETFRTSGGKNAFHVWQWVNTELWFRQFG